MAEAEIGRHADEALSRWPLQGLTIIHRFGRIAPGENIVLVRDGVAASPGSLRGGGIPDGLSEDQRAVLEARGKRKRHELGRGARPRRCRRRALDQILMAKRAKPAAKRGAGRIEISQGRRRRIADAARFRPLCRQPLHRGRTGIRARHHRSGCRGRLPGLRGAASASRPVRGVRHRARHGGRRQEDPRSDRAPRHDAKTRRLSRQQDLHARPALLCRRAHHRAALVHRRIAGLAFRRRRTTRRPAR